MTTYTAQYPPAHNDTYVKASNPYSIYYPYLGTDPTLPLTGTSVNVSWVAAVKVTVKFNIDLGSAQIIRRIYLENFHSSGLYTTRGIKNVTVYGTNSATAFANTTYSDTTDLVEIGSFMAAAHTGADASEPQYFLISNDTAYQYYVFRIVDNYGYSTMGFRHIELQTEDGYVPGGYPAEVIENGIEHSWDYFFSAIVAGIEHIWSGVVAAGIEHRWYMTATIQNGINHRWRDLPVVAGGVQHVFKNLRIITEGVEHSWTTWQVIEAGIRHRWDVFAGVYEMGIEHAFAVRNYQVVSTGVQHIWGGGGIGHDQEFTVTCSFGGSELRPYEIRRRRSRSEAGVLMTFLCAGDPSVIAGAILPDDLGYLSAADRAAALAAATIVVTINGVSKSYFATDLQHNVDVDEGYTITAESDGVLLESPYSLPVDAEYGPGMAADIAAAICAAAGFTLNWQAVNWWIPGGVLYANYEAPMDVLRKLTEAIGAMIQPDAATMTVTVKPFYPLSLPQWPTTEPDEYITYGGSFFSVAENRDRRPGYNLYTISDQLSSSASLTFEEEDIRRGQKEIRAYEVPWTGELPPLETSGGNWIVIEAGQIVEKTIEEEMIELVDGKGKTQKPIYQIIDRDYGGNISLGALSYGEDGTISSEIAGQSLCYISYKTRYWRWLVADPEDEQVQFFTMPAWADVPVTIVVTFGDVAAANGFVVVEPDDTRNVDGDGNAKSELEPGEPFYFLLQHDTTIRVDAISSSSGVVSGGSYVSRTKTGRLSFADDSSVELPYIPDGVPSMSWYGRSPALSRDGRKLKPSSYPAIGEAEYAARMLSYALSPPPISLAGEEKYYILIVINMVST